MKETLFNNRLLAFFIFFSALIPASKAQVLDWQYKDLFTDVQQSGARPSMETFMYRTGIRPQISCTLPDEPKPRASGS